MFNGWDDDFNWFFNTFSLISFSLVLFIKSFLKDAGPRLQNDKCVSIFTMCFFYPCFVTHLAFGYVFFQKYKGKASGSKYDPTSGSMEPQFIGYVPYICVLFVSTATAGFLFMVLIFLVIPAWIKMFKNRNQVAPNIEDVEERLLNDQGGDRRLT